MRPGAEASAAKEKRPPFPDVPCADDYVPNVTGQRRYLVEQYYHAVDWAKWADVRKIFDRL